MKRLRYLKIALRCSVPTWVIARDIGQRQTTPLAEARTKVYG